MTKVVSLRISSVSKPVVQTKWGIFFQGRFILDIMVSTWEAMKWANEIGEKCVKLKHDYKNPIIKLIVISSLRWFMCLGSDSRCVGIMSDLFTNSLALVFS